MERCSGERVEERSLLAGEAMLEDGERGFAVERYGWVEDVGAGHDGVGLRVCDRGVKDCADGVGVDVGHVARKDEDGGACAREGGDDAADGAGARVQVGDHGIAEREDVGVTLADERDARAEDGAEGVDRSGDERGALPGLAELVAPEAAACAPDEDNGLDLAEVVRGRVGHAM